MAGNPFDIASNINKKLGHLSVDKDSFSSFVLNKIYSNTPDSIYWANEANRFTIDDNQMLYDFYYSGLKKSNRYGKWHKQATDKEEEAILEIMECYQYSREKALEVLPILIANIDEIKEANFKGGAKQKRRK